MDLFLNFKRQELSQRYYEDSEPHLLYSRKILLMNIVLNLVLSCIIQMLCKFEVFIAQWMYYAGFSTANLLLVLLYALSFHLLKTLKGEKRRRYAKVILITMDMLQCIVIISTWLSMVCLFIRISGLNDVLWPDALLFGVHLMALLYASIQLLQIWYAKSLVLVFVLLLVGARLYEFNPSDKAVIPLFFLKSVVMAYAFYLQESSRKTLYIKKENEYERSKVWKTILNNLPEGILVLGKDSSPLYSNSSLKSLLDLLPNETVKNPSLQKFSKFKKVVITSISRDVNKIFGPEFQLNKNLLMLQDHKSRKIDLARAFYTILQEWRKNDPKSVVHYNDSTFPIMVLEACIECQEDASEDKHFQISISLSMFSNKPALIMLFTDITQLKVIVKLRDQDEYKSRMLASVSHELRTPLNASLNFLQIALDHEGVPDDIKQNALVPTQRSNLLLLNLINDILDFSRIQAKKFNLNIEKKNIVQTLKEGIELVELQAKKKNIAIMLNQEGLLSHAEFATDHTRVKQIVLNLLSNAVKFTLKGSITITLANYVCEEKKEKEREIEDNDQDKLFENEKVRVKISVEDTGIGISKEQQNLLFKEYSQVGGDNERKKLNPHGIGLGLMISNTLSSLLGPDSTFESEQAICVESEVGVGTKFSFVLEEKNQEEIKSPQRVRKFKPKPQSAKFKITPPTLKLDPSFNIFDMNSSPNQSKENSLLHSLSPSINQRSRRDQFDLKSLDGNTHSLTIEEPYFSIVNSNSNQKLSASREAFLTKTKIIISSPIYRDEREKLKRDLFSENTTKSCNCSRILVVDDDSFNIMAFESILTSLGLAADYAYNGQEAIDKIVEKNLISERNYKQCHSSYDIIFMDLNMPIMNGIEAANKIRNMIENETISAVGLISCTATLQQEFQTDFGLFDDNCTKPLTKTIVFEILNRFGILSH